MSSQVHIIQAQLLSAGGHSFPIQSPFTNDFKEAPRYCNISFVNISVCISKRDIFFCGKT